MPVMKAAALRGVVRKMSGTVKTFKYSEGLKNTKYTWDHAKLERRWSRLEPSRRTGAVFSMLRLRGEAANGRVND
jgi:hypothetical protein